ncbi:PucR family transcriptional regulator [Microbacterium sp. P03]|uniref:PucR family transcriptional regulator n=1 Tax=Microbacterium sp. P03 TaxID=3366946 RepID=UPI00374610A5
MAATTETPTLRALLHRADLQLRLEGTEQELDEGALDLPVRWVHSSDLTDPTPFLSEGLALLTTGTQFDSEDAYGPYVARLRARGVRGLGFGTEVARDGIPAGLAAACRAQRIPLFEVPYRTPFIAVARANAEATAAQAYARRSWSLAAQRALSLAALRSDGLGATLAELARQLGCWVGLYDGAGTLTREHPTTLPDAVRNELAQEVGIVLRRGARAGSSLRVVDTPFQLQTLGRGGHLRGVLAVGAGDLDQDARGVLVAVVAMVELAFAQGERLENGRSRLRTAILEALVAGDSALAGRLSRAVWGPLPAEPFVLGFARPDTDAIDEHLEQQAADGRIFYARGDEGIVMIVPEADTASLSAVAMRFSMRVGASAPAGYDDTSKALSQAREALAFGLRSSRDGVTGFADVAASGVLTSLRSDAARLRADAVLEPLDAYDTAHSTPLRETLRVWLEQDARFDAAATALGVHRHTVRARIAQVSRLLDVDLAGFPARAEVWAALQLAD